MQYSNDITNNTIAVLALIVAILGLIVAAVAPVFGSLTALILVAFIGGVVTGAWADRRQLRPDKEPRA
jgi:hypothetical protein